MKLQNTLRRILLEVDASFEIEAVEKFLFGDNELTDDEFDEIVMDINLEIILTRHGRQRNRRLYASKDLQSVLRKVYAEIDSFKDME